MANQSFQPTQTVDEALSSQLSPLIVVEQVSKKLHSKAGETVILDAVSFKVARGSLFAINGPSGSGKSTILNILTGIDRPSSGRILFEGQEMRRTNENQMARWRGQHVGIIFQFFQLLPTLTVQENILMALELGGSMPRHQWKTRALECLQLVGLNEHAKRLPAQLSGGQQQRVAIARALANDPPLLVADEPTGNLDSKMAAQVFSLLASLTQRGKTVIYVTHDSKLAAQAQASISLLDGRLVGPNQSSSVIAEAQL